MSAEESAETRQNNELEALEAIYGDDLKDLRAKGAWNGWTPLNLSISLKPQQGSSGFHEIHVKVDLHVVCTDAYPNSVPKITLENGKGLSDNALFQLQNELEARTLKLKGEEMIFQLSQYVQEFLHLHNKPTSKSFYDEMLQRQKEKEEKDLQAKLMEEDRQRQFMQQEVQRRQEILKSESRLRREHRYNSENSCENDSDYRRHSVSNNSNESSDECLCDHRKTTIIEFGNREIKRGQCLKHCSCNHVVFIGMDVKTGEIVLLSEWVLKNSKQLASLEQEFNYLAKLRHPNLAHYLNFKYDQQPDGKVVVYFLKEFVNGPNCAFFMNENFTVSIQSIKYISRGVLTALDYLHRNNVVHKDIRETCVYITEKGTVALSNYSLHKRLTDLSSQTNISTYYSKKTDILRFGVFIVSLLQGAPITIDDVGIPTSVPSDLYDFLTRCLAKHEKERYTAAQLLNHSFFNQSLVPQSPGHKMDQNIPDRNISPDVIHSELSQLQQSGQSRINQEFVFIQNLGKGAFGDVIKARNNLDGGYYAIKRIKLNPKNRQLNKKIVREVKLLSRLNHENIVRYYNSWIETTFTFTDNIEELAPPMKNVEVSITYDSKSQAAFNSSTDEESSDDENSWGVFDEDSDSDGIEFEKDDNAESIIEQSNHSSKSTHSKDSSSEISIDFMYIQMEFCEKSTLRNAIDNSVYLDEDRVWRLFREIVEGLAHIHQQGMIHRDLKPVNIFLDSADHVKIGDFGLATNIKPKLNEYNIDNYPMEKDDTMDESKTGLIGTALYVAPELSVASKANYNQKVDIYSLGIIFFEMCYRPLTTNMERITILTGLRKREIILPDDFANKQNTKQEILIKWLLNHDVSKRPTSLELLQSEHVPPPVLEECELRELVRHTLSNPQLKGYKYLIASCFNQTLTPAQDITYDKDPSAPNLTKPLQLYDFVKETIVKIFKQHGGQNLSTPLLMPKSKYFEGVESCVKLMTHFGGIVALPHDLRVPFARYVAWNGITMLRRYSIERVYREKKVFGFLPRELYECAFDIVTTTPGNLMPDAEILYIIYEIINELPGVKNKHFTIRLNHTALLKAILLHAGIKEKHQEVFQMFSDVKDGKVQKSSLQTYLIRFGLPDNVISTLINIFNSEFELCKAANQLQAITRKKSGDASHLAKQALQDLKSIAHNAEAFGVTFEMVIAPGLVYNVQQHSGMICQFVCEAKKKHKHGNKEVLAAGGRYDSMITSYRKIMEAANVHGKEIQQLAVGISLSLDKLVQAVIREQCDDLPKMEFLDVAVCSVGSKPLLREKTKVLRNLWAAGIRCALIEATNNEEIQEQCGELKVPHVVMLKDSDQGTVRVRSWERDRFQEKTFKMHELVENMQKIIKNWKEGCQEFIPVTGTISRSDSKSSYGEKNEHNHEANVTVLFVTAEKLSANVRKRYDIQIRSHLDGVFKKLNGYVTVLGLSLESKVIRTIASYLEFETDQIFHKSVEIIIEKHQRHKKHLSDVCDEIYEQKCKRTKPVIILFSLNDSFHRLLI
ncbi:Pkinase, RWD and/or tRNA-synt His domain containing protein [Asbolus verrucosus]|uniref:non-specific serine/threonine protein kinase n=1 Tax=Asbolus verrucosus TaxID=1661398 RepID=A0A482VSH0_ASBVE|nr:Pkinase, RWD and/or tRNA-synt His domain containing protein [Asbolus verrucosus]